MEPPSILNKKEVSHQTSWAALENGYKIVKSKETYGIAAPSGRIVIPMSYKEIGWSDQSEFLVKEHIGFKNNDRWGLINLKSHRISAANYISLSPYKDELLIASNRQTGAITQNFGVINLQGKTIVSFKYRFLSKSGDYLIASIDKDNRVIYGLIDQKDHVVIPFKYKKIRSLKGGQIAITNTDGSVGLFTHDGNAITQFKYDDIIALNDEYHICKINGKSGLLKNNGDEVVAPFYKEIKIDDGALVGLPYPEWHLLTGENVALNIYHYDTISRINASLLKADIEDNEFIIDLKNNPILPLRHRHFGDFDYGYSIIEEDGLKGVINYDKVIIPTTFKEIYQYHNYFVTNRQVATDFQWDLYDAKGKRLNNIYYDKINKFSEGFFGARKNDQWGFLDEFGREVIKAEYDEVGDFQNGFAKVRKGNYFGIIDRYGRNIIPLEYNKIAIVNESLFILKSNFTYIIHKMGTGKVYSSHYELYPAKGYVMEVNNSGLKGLFDRKGQRILTTTYEDIEVSKSDKIHTFSKEGKLGILTLDGGILIGIEENLTEVLQISPKYIGIKLNHKYGFIDYNGNLRIANRYDSIGTMCENMIAINLLKKWGYIDHIERIRIQPKYDFAGEFKNNSAVVGRDGKFGLIDNNGKELLKLNYDLISRNKYGSYVTGRNNKHGLVNETGYEVIFPKYDYVEDNGNGNIIIASAGKYGLINEKGMISIPISYDNLIFDADNNQYFGLKQSDWIKIH